MKFFVTNCLSLILAVAALVAAINGCGTTKPAVPVLTAPHGDLGDRPWLEKPEPDRPSLPRLPEPVQSRVSTLALTTTNHAVMPTRLVWGFEFFATKYTNLVGFAESSTNLLSTNWVLQAHFPYPTNGIIIYGTNAFTNHGSFFVRAGYTLPRTNMLPP